jgi:hypothetical protein
VRRHLASARARTKTIVTDLVLGSPTVAAMARPGMASRLAKLGIVDLE